MDCTSLWCMAIFILLISTKNILLSLESINLYFWHWKYPVWYLVIILYGCIYDSFQIHYKKEKYNYMLIHNQQKWQTHSHYVQVNRGLLQNLSVNRISNNTEYRIIHNTEKKKRRISMSLSRSSLSPTVVLFPVYISCILPQSACVVSNITLLQNQQILYWTI